MYSTYMHIIKQGVKRLDTFNQRTEDNHPTATRYVTTKNSRDRHTKIHLLVSLGYTCTVLSVKTQACAEIATGHSLPTSTETPLTNKKRLINH